MPKKKQDLPYLPFYIGDWKKDPAVQSLTKEEKYIWFELIMLMWESLERGYLTINGVPMSMSQIANALNLSEKKTKFYINFFEKLGLFSRRLEDKSIYSRKILKMLKIKEERCKSGSKGGNPNLIKDNIEAF
jgi:hypothetical protein